MKNNKQLSILITGASGQDGAILSKLLIDQGYKVYGMLRRSASRDLWRLKELNLLKDIDLVEGDLTDYSSLARNIRNIKPHAILNTAAQSHVGISFDQPIVTAEITGLGVLNLLEAVREVDKDIRFVNFASSEMFGGTHNSTNKEFLNEQTVLDPMSPYAAAKVFSYNCCRIYRRSYNMFCSNLIGFNHESEFRGDTFVTRKITKAAAKIKLGKQDKLYLGNTKSYRDWSSAWDICEGVIIISNHDKPDDFVLGSGEKHSVQEFVEYAFNYVGLDYKNHLEIDPKFFRPGEVHALLADYSKAKKILGWKPKTTFKELVEMMVDADLARNK